MNVLLVEDDPFKEEAIGVALKEVVVVERLVCARAVQTAVESVCATSYDLIILDIALPSHDRALGVGNPKSMPSGGVEVLLELNRLRRSDAVLIVTQYPEVEIWGELVRLPEVIGRLSEEISVNLIGILHFDQSNANWRASFARFIGGI
ncbi:hypothetical protein NKH99_03050 [Mesorhizobium sp. M0854]|uniref:hypothetical protein n=1 Tax=Mesorhizobium sp. M0854 TaxID=2957013 RepID=UPI00333A296C